MLVVALLGILAAIVIVAINPARQIGLTNNTQRKADVNTILNAVYQYALDNSGSLPASISTTVLPVCKTGAICTGLVDLTVLTTSERYLTAMPFDPTGASATSTGYTIVRTANNRVTVAAPSAQLGATISVTK